MVALGVGSPVYMGFLWRENAMRFLIRQDLEMNKTWK
jgi:hypothetical protein